MNITIQVDSADLLKYIDGCKQRGAWLQGFIEGIGELDHTKPYDGCFLEYLKSIDDEQIKKDLIELDIEEWEDEILLVP